MVAIRHYAAAPILALLAGCTGQPMGPDRDPAGEAALAHALAGKVAGPPLSCLPSHRSDNMEVIDRDTIIYRDGRTTYVQNTDGYCYPNGPRGGFTLVTTRVGTDELCRGDIGKVINSSSGTFAGSCTFNEFIPYRAP